MHYRIPAMAALLLVGSSAYALAQTAMPAMPGMGTGVVTMNLKAQNSSGETATATLAQAGDDVKVTVVTTGGGTDPQPIHIHTGTCAKLDPKPTYPLTTVQDGKSVTTLKALKLSDLETGNYAINIHKSTTDIGTYVSCGDIPKLAKM
jgi:Cu/Zn superoxide dismutase